MIFTGDKIRHIQFHHTEGIGDFMSAAGKGKILYILQTMTIIPILIFGFLVMLLGTHLVTGSMHGEVETDLSNVANTFVIMLDQLYPGDYHLEGEKSYRLYKGNQDLTGDYALIDRIKEQTGLDITLFYQDTRILTTLTDKNNQRIVGTGAPEEVLQNVYGTDNANFYNNTSIYGTRYFSYYTPLHNQDGSVAGMLFVGKPSSNVDAAIQSCINPLIVTDILLALVVAVIIFLYTRKFASCLLQLHHFLGEVASGNMTAKLDSKLIHRRDELGGIARSALDMQRSLRTLIDRDALTSLLNRRSGDARLRNTIEEATSQGTPFCVAIGDIDFFKKVNDTYGHECGDLVLKSVSEVLRHHMHGRGFAARWGGEEFLLVFQQADLDQAYSLLESLLIKIRALEISYNDQLIKVTMTFGVAPGSDCDMKDLVRVADEKLYEGKTSGRNQVVR